MTTDPGERRLSGKDDTALEPTKFHQRLTQSLSIRTQQVHKSPSFAFHDKLRRPSFSLLRRPQPVSPIQDDQDDPVTHSPLLLDKELPSPPMTTDHPPPPDVAVPLSSSTSSSSATPSTPSESHQFNFETVDQWLQAYFVHPSDSHSANILEAKHSLVQLIAAYTISHPSSSWLHSLQDQIQQVDMQTKNEDALQVLQKIALALTPQPKLTPDHIQPFVHESITQTNQRDQATWPDHVAKHISWFEDYFFGGSYITVLAPMAASPASTPSRYSLISAILLDHLEEPAYCLILRHPHRPIQRQMVPLTDARVYPWPSKPSKPRRSLVRTQSSLMNSPAKENTRLLAAALLIACPDLDISKAKKVLLPSMAHTKLERDLHRWDLHEMPSKYKFGALTVQPGQTKEEQWFSNTGTTDAYDTFLNILGRRIQLRGFQGYPAGLDTFTGESGETSVISSWQHYEMMFHVAALMPFRPNDRQQVHRKRYLGNDIVCVVFLDGPDALFDPTAIKSKFLHVYILVQPVSPQGWRVEVVRKQAVPEFGPPLPNPPIFDDPQRLHEFLAVKLVNAENAALKCEPFAGNGRARTSLLESYVETCLASPGLTPLYPEESRLSLKASLSKRRPKSSTPTTSRGNPHHRLSRASMGSIRSTPDTCTPRSPSMEEVPPLPIPSPTRSTMLQDFKNFALRRAATMTRATSNEPDRSSPPLSSSHTSHSFSGSSPGKLRSISFTSSQQGDPSPLLQRSILATKARSALFRSQSPPQSQSLEALPEPSVSTSQPQTSDDSLRHRAQNLIINAVPKRSRPTIPALHASQDS